jgi:purine nucleosidase
MALLQPLRTVLIDTDTASDDAVAIIMALRSPSVRVMAITVVAGNVSLEQATRNALYAVEICGADVPVYAGASGPLVHPLKTAEWFHGADGLGDHGYTPVRRRAESIHALDAIISAVLACPGIEIITLGPLTNLALAIAREPRIVSQIGRCVVMGGAPCCEGNVTPAAEFNIWVDPDAARAVFQSGLNIEMIGWQLSRFDAVLEVADIQRILNLDNALAHFAIRCNSVGQAAYHLQTGEVGISLPDPVAMAILLNPALSLSSSKHWVHVETSHGIMRGMTLVDRLGVAGDQRNAGTWAPTVSHGRPVEICWKLDVVGWKKALFDSLL